MVPNKAGTSVSLEVHHNGQLAGALTFNGIFEIIDCIVRHGRKYEAKITQINAGQYIVLVAPV